jgi:hypothetical protein
MEFLNTRSATSKNDDGGAIARAAIFGMNWED